MTKLKILGAAVVASILMTASANAATVRVTVAGSEWDVTTINANYHDFKPLWASQPWWGSDSLAVSFLYAVGQSLVGADNQPVYFALPFLGTATPPQDLFRMVSLDSGGYMYSGYITTDPDYNFAVATAVSDVPLPAGGVLLLTSLAGFAALRRQNKLASQV
jgi:hypothetical protein